ncbi:hypothetical protein SPRG_21323 [Saprolegnia parasitica CBS 223.65]|uniref:Histidine acid phosphatase n=1 Tax=Saprolegnia parasitica (strain CBS 223.65) TaxID=695850 RepID=A0A067BVH0_SAPPC|nr:hypothetical protein SPRG_21323 [Saprolegnia parasitica CBS 223.65]KDO20835.1 hypothetical protein SPRG_21323 [Saprolegnia parasitica CBS 223.65]|eukprot:XP_012208496.1 hypothetical protein SPRG_21323 [Saprolegnia parasitica CBS 223.65]
MQHAFSAIALLASTAMGDSLRQVAVVSRHGVRGPYGPDGLPPTLANMQRYSKNAFPFLVSAKDWGTSQNASELVSPKLTAHGRNAIQKMGEYFGAHLYPSLAQPSTCHATFAYADDNERDIDTAQAFLDGFLPSACAAVKPDTNGSRLLFEQGQDPTAACPATSQTLYKGIVGNATADNIVRHLVPEIQALNDIVDCCQPDVCAVASARSLLAGPPTTCTLFTVPSTWSGKFYEPWSDAFSEAQYLSEWFLLQSLNNMPLPPNKTLDEMVALGQVHNAHMQLVTNQFNAENFGSTLLVHLVAGMEEAITRVAVPIAPGPGPHLLHDVASNFLFYAGHDINLLYLKNLLRMEWATNDWNLNQPNPGSMLLFEVHADANKSASTSQEDFFVQAYFVAASPQQIRGAETLSPTNPPNRVPVSIPQCSKDVVLANGELQVQCRFQDFKATVGKAIRHACVSPSLQSYASTLWHEEAASMRFAWSMETVALVLLSLILLIVTVRYIRLARAHASAEYGKYAPLV